MMSNCVQHPRNLVSSPSRKLGHDRGQSATGSTTVKGDHRDVYLFPSKDMENGNSASSSCSSPLAGQGGWLLKLLKRKAFSGSRRSGTTTSVHNTSNGGRANCLQSKEDDAQEERVSVDHLKQEVQLLRQRLENEEEEMQKLRLEVSSLRLHEARAKNDFQQKSEINLSSDDVDLSQTNGVNQHGSDFGNHNQSHGPEICQENTAQLARLHDHVQTTGTKTSDRRELPRGYVDEIDAGQKVTECVKSIINSRQLCLSSIPMYEPDNFYKSGEAKEISKDSRSPPESTDDSEDLLFGLSLADTESSSVVSPVKSNSSTLAIECTMSPVAPVNKSRKLQSEVFRSSELASPKVTIAARDPQTPASGTSPEDSPGKVINNCYSQGTPKSRRTATKLDADELVEESRTTEMLQSNAELERLLKTMQRLRREELAMEKSNEIPSWSSLKSVAASNPQPLPTPQLLEAGQKVSSRDSKSSILPWKERGTAQSKTSSKYSRDPSKNSASDNLKDATDDTAVRSTKMYSYCPAGATESRHGNLSRSSSSSAPGTREISNHSQHNGNLRRSQSTAIPRARAHSKEFSSQPDGNRANFHYSSENSTLTPEALASSQVGDLEDEVRQCLEQSRLLLSDTSETEHERKLSRETSFSVLTLARQRRRSTGECTYKADRRKHQGEQVQATRLKQNVTTDAEIIVSSDTEVADENLVTITPHRLCDAIGSRDKKRIDKYVQVSSPQSVSSRRSRFYQEAISPGVSCEESSLVEIRAKTGFGSTIDILD